MRLLATSIPFGEVAKIRMTQGPSSIRTENAQLAAYTFVDVRDRNLVGYVEDAKKAVAAGVTFPPGAYVTWSGQFGGFTSVFGALAADPATVGQFNSSAMLGGGGSNW